MGTEIERKKQKILQMNHLLVESSSPHLWGGLFSILDSVAEEATLRDGGIEKANIVGIPHLIKV